MPSSATLGSDSTFVGTILAGATITADTDATIAGRLLASTGAVNLHPNLVTRPAGCTNTTGGSSSGNGGTGGSVTGGSSTTGGTSSSPTQTGTLAATGVSTVPAGLALGLLASGVVLTVLRRRIPQARH